VGAPLAVAVGQAQLETVVSDSDSDGSGSCCNVEVGPDVDCALSASFWNFFMSTQCLPPAGSVGFEPVRMGSLK
jgi:hypothetical protein